MWFLDRDAGILIRPDVPVLVGTDGRPERVGNPHAVVRLLWIEVLRLGDVAPELSRAPEDHRVPEGYVVLSREVESPEHIRRFRREDPP